MELYTLLLLVLACHLVTGTTSTNETTVVKDHKDIYRILVLLPHRKGSYNFPFGREMAGSAVLSAFQQIEEDGIISSMSLEAVYADTGCNGVTGLGRAHDMLSAQRYSAILGVQCSQACAEVGRLAAYLNLPCFSGLCQDVEMLNKQEFSTLTRLLGTFEMTGFAVAQLLHRFSWARVSILAERRTDIVWLLTKNGLEYSLPKSNVTIASSELLFADTDLEATLLQAAAVSRIIILAMNGDMFDTILRHAIAHDLTKGDYIFICINYYKQRKIFGVYDWRQGRDDDEMLREAYKSVFFLSYYNRDQTDTYQRFTAFVKNASAELFDYHYTADEEVPYPAANLYEATYLLALSLNETLSKGEDVHNGTLVAQRLWGRSFDSITGGLSLNANGDRDQAYTIQHLQGQHQGEVEFFGIYFARNASLQVYPPSITWPGGGEGPPSDTPPCGFDGELCAEDLNAKFRRTVATFTGSLVSVVVIGAVAFFFIYRRLKWEKEVAEMNWRIKYSDIVFPNKQNGASCSQTGMFSLISLRSSSSNVGSMNTTMSRFHFTLTGYVKGVLAALKPIKHITAVDLSDKAFLQEMKQLYDLTHANIAKIIGATVESPHIYVISEYCSKGSLQDLLENDDVELDIPFKYSLMNDVVKGLFYLHTSFRKSHGNLKSSNCVVDSRFMVKLTDFGPTNWQKCMFAKGKDLLWTPPELLIDNGSIMSKNPSADIYAFGIILQEILLREGAFYTSEVTLDADEIIRRVRRRESPPFRPSTTSDVGGSHLQRLIEECWDDNDVIRPDIEECGQRLKKVFGSNFKAGNLMDNLLKRMEQYANNLESLVNDRTTKYLEEKKRVEELLHRLLPKSVAEELQAKSYVRPRTYDLVTVYFSDIVCFTDLCSESNPMQVVTLLNDLYTTFDKIIETFDVYKVETIGDAYMTVSGLPNTNDDHAVEIAKMALKLRNNIHSFKIRHQPDRQLLLRIGIHSGPCVAGVVGVTMPRYCLFGDTINTASRMESAGEALRIHISQETRDLLANYGGFDIEDRGLTSIKGKGALKTYWLNSYGGDLDDTMST